MNIYVNGFRDIVLFPLNPSKVLGTLQMEPSKVFSPDSSVSDQYIVMPKNSTSSTSHTSAAVATGTDPSTENAASCNTSDAPNIIDGSLK